ncbi:hypothetical protein PROFUN_04225 [Planoprotostelium fungivorum]|uniref:BZIP domain-containing protein n=1 Tax=Planoprotostelium fungivorum TaxID=1890364 RepID=A0A2P6NVY9_9EUKA|nr:hypothetical protein PROFUN_04225 [Planoprotostelium fungivorum]
MSTYDPTLSYEEDPYGLKSPYPPSSYMDRDILGYNTPYTTFSSSQDPTALLEYILDTPNGVSNDPPSDWNGYNQSGTSDECSSSPQDPTLDFNSSPPISVSPSPPVVPSLSLTNSKSFPVPSTAYTPPARLHTQTQALDKEVQNQQESVEQNEGNGENRSLKRKQQTRTASKLYRERKKTLELQLTERLNRLEDERAALIQKNEKAERLLAEVQAENIRLRAQQESTTKGLQDDRALLLEKLRDMLMQESSDAELVLVLNEIRDIDKVKMGIGACALRRLISAPTIHALMDTGFFENEENLRIMRERRGLEWARDYIMREMQDMTPSQTEGLKKISETRGEELSVISMERMQLIPQLLNAMRALRNDTDDQNSFLNAVTCLEHLRLNLTADNRVMHSGIEQMNDVLTPRQHAIVKTRLNNCCNAVKQLLLFWNALMDADRKAI